MLDISESLRRICSCKCITVREQFCKWFRVATFETSESLSGVEPYISILVEQAPNEHLAQNPIRSF